MFVTSNADKVPLGAITILRVVNFVERTLALYQEWTLVRRTRNELLQLSDAQLDDIGLSRDRIY